MHPVFRVSGLGFSRGGGVVLLQLGLRDRLDEAVVEEAAIMKRKMERKGMGKGPGGLQSLECGVWA